MKILGFIILLLIALVLLVIALSIAYPGRKERELWYRLFPPRCEVCGKKGNARPCYADYDPKDPGSLGIQFLCPECEAKKQQAFLARWGVGKKKTKE